MPAWGLGPLAAPSRLDALEEAGGAHSAADAHRDDGIAAAPALELVEGRRRQLGAGAPERMSERDRTAVHVELLVRDLEHALHVDGLAGEGLVDLEQIDVAYCETGLGEELL